MRWRNLRDHLIFLSNQWLSTEVVIIHAGGNDLGRVRTWDLLCEMKRNLASFKLLFPHATIAFLEMLPRLLWMASSNLCYLEKIRKRLNRTIHNSLVSLGGMSYRHYNLEGFFAGFYRSDLVHLSDVTLDIFRSAKPCR